MSDLVSAKTKTSIFLSIKSIKFSNLFLIEFIYETVKFLGYFILSLSTGNCIVVFCRVLLLTFESSCLPMAAFQFHWRAWLENLLVLAATLSFDVDVSHHILLHEVVQYRRFTPF